MDDDLRRGSRSASGARTTSRSTTRCSTASARRTSRRSARCATSPPSSSAPSAPATTTSTCSRATTITSGSASTSARAASGTRPRAGFLALAAGRRFDETRAGGRDGLAAGAAPRRLRARPGVHRGDAARGRVRLRGARRRRRQGARDPRRAAPTYEVHNHHNFAWRERHFGADVWVIRKGCTPAFPGQEGFVGATMGEPSVILRGTDRARGRGAAVSAPSTAPAG